MFVIERLADVSDLSGVEIDTVSLTWERRRKARQRLTTAAGREIGLALPTGTVLRPGDILRCDETLAIRVDAVAEEVFVMRPETWETACVACHQLGNLHRPISLDGREILALYEPSMEALLDRMGLNYSVERRVFSPPKLDVTSSHVH